MTDKKVLIKEVIRNNPNLSGNQLYNQIKGTELGIRKQTLQELVREIRNIAEPTIQKREASIPKKFKTVKTKLKIREKAKERIKERIKLKKEPEVKPEPEPEVKPKKKRIPFEKTKFGKMTKTVQTKFKISERNAIERLRILLKIPKDDYGSLNSKDFDILTQYGY